MTHFDGIYDIAADGYGIVTAAQAQEAGVSLSELMLMFTKKWS